ncbi:DHA2 family efflux MFS transporter permease subunit [Paenibacillus sp. IB182496]|uniref:DHA2 family efflux MFS transporter permease subunit n=1 Tax=Paenibacillus sabuli TaxID=2772509 RepID=A0A927BRH1_9BACL|nr:DHA2 family efflux MFS transporter permease subunit [Paenibacillus sabuli]MBD2845411.1 DHA2 family efflux MFS transporter permease subunit [Paenibacillus sabuli]
MTGPKASSPAGHAATEAEFSLLKLLPPLLAIIIGMFMVILDTTVVNNAIPSLVIEFDTPLHTLQWAVTGYTLALSAVIPLAGWLSDRFSPKRVFVATIILFTIGSALCALATNPTELIIYRVIQGLGGGMVAPIGMALVFRLSPPDKRGAVMGVLGIPILLAPALGPVLSGYFVEYVSWQWIFLINVPIGVAAVIVGLRYLPVFDRAKPPALDILGMILGPIAFAMLAFGVSEGGADWGSARTLSGLIVGGVALILFIIVELRHRQPLLELRVFRSLAFTQGIVLLWILFAALFGSIILFPLLLQQVKGFSPLETGLILLPQALGSMLFMPIGGRLYDRIGAKPIVIAGTVFIATALLIMSQITLDRPTFAIMANLFLLGAGMGLSMMTMNTYILSAAPRELVNRVTPLTNSAQQVVISFAVAGLTGYLSSHTESLMASYTGSNPLEAAVTGFGDTFLLTSGLAMAGFVIALFMRRIQPAPKDAKQAGAAAESAMASH